VKRLLALSALLLVATAPAAWADHHEQLDGCDHGATSVPCRPDPSPSGQDCDSHGNHGGINEDHCTKETRTCDSLELCPTTTSEPSTTSTSTPAPSGTTTTTATPTTTTASVPITATPTTTATPSTTATSTPAPTTELPMTGAATTTLLFAGAWLILSGLAAMLIGATLKGAAVASEPGGGAGEATAAGPEYHDGTRGETL
jgi:hypothetical protein